MPHVREVGPLLGLQAVTLHGGHTVAGRVYGRLPTTYDNLCAQQSHAMASSG